MNIYHPAEVYKPVEIHEDNETSENLSYTPKTKILSRKNVLLMVGLVLTLVVTVGLALLIDSQHLNLAKKAAEVIFAPSPISAGEPGQTLFSEKFDNGLSNWEIPASAQKNVTLGTDPSASTNKVLLFNYAPPSEPLRATHSFASSLSNVVVRARFYDPMTTNEGTMFNIKDSNNNLTAIGVNTGNTKVGAVNYYFRYDKNGQINEFDSKVKRSKGWHTFEFVVLSSGTYGKIDGMLLTDPYAPKDWFDQVEAVTILYNPNQTSISKINLISTWGLYCQVFYDDIEVISPPTDPDQLALSLNDWYFKYYEQTQYNISKNSLLTGGNVLISYLRTAIEYAFRYRTKNDAAALAKAKNILFSDIFTKLTPNDWRTLNGWRDLPMSTEQMATLSQLIWDQFTPSEQNLVLQYTKAGVEQFLGDSAHPRLPASCFGEAGKGLDSEGKPCAAGDTSAEDNSWNAASLAFTYNFLSVHEPSYARLTELEKRARCYAYHSITTDVDDAKGTDACSVDTQTVYPDGNLVNHGWSSPNYMMATIGSLAKGALYYRLFGKPIPNEFSHNVSLVWNYYWSDKNNFVDKNTYFYKTHVERFQGGFLTVAPSIMDFLQDLLPGTFTDDKKLEVLQKKYLLQYGTPLYYHPTPVAIINPDQDSGTPFLSWIQEVTNFHSFMTGYLRRHNLFTSNSSPTLLPTTLPTLSPILTPTPAAQPASVLETRFYDDGSPTLGTMFNVKDSAGNVTAIGVNTSSYANDYYFRFDANGNSTMLDSTITRSRGWHTFKLTVTKTGTRGEIDGRAVTVGYNSAQTSIASVNLISTWNLYGQSYYDDVKLTTNGNLVFQENFESGLNQWILTNTSGAIKLAIDPENGQNHALNLNYASPTPLRATHSF